MQHAVAGQDRKPSSGKARPGVVQPISPMKFVIPGVTDREAEVVGWLAKGLTNKAIASKLQISSRTVQKHMERMFKKLGVHSRAELVARAYMSGTLIGN